MKKVVVSVAMVALLSLSMVSMVFAAGGLKLHPSGFGEQSYAAWKAKEGLPDSSGKANHALYLQKMTETSTFAAAVAMIDGVEGMPVSALTGLEWEHRNDGHCGAGAPRWNVGVTGSSGTDYTLFLGCAAAVHSPGSGTNWTRDTYAGPAIVAVGGSNAGLTPAQQADAAAGTVRYLAIVFDEGTDQGQGYVYLDNIKVNNQVWTGPQDNGK